MNRRHFIARGTAGVAIAGLAKIGWAQSATRPAEVTGRQKLDQNLANEFVAAAHADLATVKQMLDDEPAAQKRLGGLVLAQRELILGDLETALGGAAHMGLRDIALLLLSRGARIDAFAAAMLGYRDVVQALLKASPQTAITKGPHAYTLLYHAAISGNVAIAEDIKPHLAAGATDFNQALTGAAREGQLEMVRFLLANGVTDPNAKDGIGNTALKYAVQKRFTEIADELRKRGAQ